MKFFISLLLTAVLTPALAAQTADFYVSTEGSDAWSGTLAKPNGQQTDGPFATLQQARDAVPNLRKRPGSDVLVLVRGGSYPLTKTVVFGLQDSGQGESTVTFDSNPIRRR